MTLAAAVFCALVLLSEECGAVAVRRGGGSGLAGHGGEALEFAPLLLQQELRSGFTATSLQARLRRMSGVEALKAVRGRKDLPHKLKLALQELGSSRRNAKRFRHNQTLKEDTSAARAMLSQLVEGTTKKLDMEQVRCSEYQERQRRLLTETRQDISMFQSGAAAERGKILRAEANLHDANLHLPRLQDLKRANQQKCSLLHDALKGQIYMLSEDLGALTGLGACEDGEGLALLQCKTQRHSSRQYVTFGSSGLRRNVSRVRSKFGRAAMQQALRRAYDKAAESPMLLELSRHARLFRVGATSARSSARLGTSSCVGARSLDCAGINAEFVNVQASMMDKWEDLKEELGRSQKDCQTTDRDYAAQVLIYQEQQRDGDTSLAESTKELNINEEQFRLKNMQVRDLEMDYSKTAEKCKDMLNSFVSELCTLKKVRSELEKMSGADGSIQDCAVTDWAPEDCSATCGGGIQVLRRQVVSPPSPGGSSCPPLQLERKCGEQECPVDCELDPWSAWGSCSAICGGGVRQRVRSVRVEPTHGGQSCSQLSETEGCNLQPCDRECELADWSEWSECSKMCNGGSRVRGKDVMVEASGSGTCPAEDARLEWKPCNTQSCTGAAAPDGGVLCEAKLDVILVLDGSGFAADGEWEQMVKASTQLVKRFVGGGDLVRLGVLLFSGPSDLATYRACTQALAQSPPDMEKDCRFVWTSHLTDDIASVAAAVGGISRPGGTTLTARAAMSALEELRGGRNDAESVVMIVTDSAPTSRRAMAQVADRVRTQARLMWVPVSCKAPLEQIRTWASRPVEENVIPIENTLELVKPSTITRIIANMCPKLTGIASSVKALETANGSLAGDTTDGNIINGSTDDGGNVSKPISYSYELYSRKVACKASKALTSKAVDIGTCSALAYALGKTMSQDSWFFSYNPTNQECWAYKKCDAMDPADSFFNTFRVFMSGR